MYSLERQDCKRNLFNVSLFDVGVGEKNRLEAGSGRGAAIPVANFGTF